MIQEHYDGLEEFEIAPQTLQVICLNIEAEIEKLLIGCKELNLYEIIFDAFAEHYDFTMLE
jgi:hypothetical protein